MKFKYTILSVAVAVACSADLPQNAVKDVLDTPALKNTRVQGKIGAKLEKFMYERCRSDFARSVVVREAREAFAYPDDDVYNAPLGMWKGEFWGKLMISSARVAQYTDDPAARLSADRSSSRRARSWATPPRTFSAPTSTRAAGASSCVRSQATA